MIELKSSNNFTNTRARINKLLHGNLYSELDRYGKMGVDALSAATPVRTGLTAHSWAYRIIHNGKHSGVEWYNTNVVDGTPVAIIIQYGHATGTGGYVHGIDYINPAMRPVFQEIAADLWKKVTS